MRLRWNVAATLRQRHWAVQAQAGLDYVTVSDFALYDHVANHVQLLGCEPARFGFHANVPPLVHYFAMARGTSTHSDCAAPSCQRTDPNALEMTK
jgi:5-methyltetrahydropteroyltriglutamate--homocysteine methyltransferase